MSRSLDTETSEPNPHTFFVLLYNVRLLEYILDNLDAVILIKDSKLCVDTVGFSYFC